MSLHYYDPLSSRVRSKEDERDTAYDGGDFLSREQFKALMTRIRVKYTAMATLADSARIEHLTEVRGGPYNPDRFPLKRVVQALVRVSPKAQQLNEKYFGGRLK